MNEILAKNLKSAVTKSRDQKVKFALVLKGGRDGALIVNQKIENSDIDQAKKESGGTAVVKGFCYGDGEKIIFEVGKDPAGNRESWEKAAKTIASREAKVTIHPEFRYSKDAESELPPSKPGVDGKAEYEKKLKELAPRIDQARHFLPNFSEIGDPLEQAQEQAENGNYNNAMIGLAVVEKIVNKVLSTGEQPQSPAGKEWEKRLKKEQPDIDKALLVLHQDKRILKKAFDEARKLAGEKHFDRALPLLTAATSTAKKILEDAKEPLEGGKLQKTYEEYLKGAKEAYLGLERDHPELAKKYEPTLKQVEALGKDGEYVEGIIACENFVNVIDNCWKTIEIGENVDFTNATTGVSVGSGSYGEVFELNTGDGKSSLVLKEGDPTEMQKEAELYKQIGPHPNLARCFGVQTVGGKTGMVMESIKGGTVDQAMKNLQKRMDNGEITPEEYWGAMQLTLKKTLEVLAFLESQGIAHMDIKPDNIMIDKETGEIKVIDLGVGGKSGVTGGTPGYMSPQSTADQGASTQDDIFSVGATAYEMGERKRFSYDKAMPNHPNPQVRAMIMGNFARQWGKDNPNVTALKQKKVDRDKGEKNAQGNYSHETAYVEFVNALMNPNANPRPTASQALQAPFLTDLIISEEKAKEVLKGGKQQPKVKSDKAGIKVDVTAGFTADAFKKTMKDAFAKGAVSDPGGTATMIIEALNKLPDHEDKFSKLDIHDQLADVGGHGKAGITALDIVVKGVANLLKRPDFQGHPTINEYLEEFKDQAEYKRDAFRADRTQVSVSLTPGFTKAALKKTLQDAATAGALPDAGGATSDAVADAIDKLVLLETKYTNLDPQTHWNDVEPTSTQGLAAIDVISNGILTLLQQPDFGDHPSINRYLQLAARKAGLKRPNFAMKTRDVAPATLIADHFHDAWTNAKNAASTDFHTAVPLLLQHINTESLKQPVKDRKGFIKKELTRTGLDQVKNIDKFFDFSENLGSALDAFEKAKNKGGGDKERKKANDILFKYFQTVQGRKNDLPKGVGPDFCTPLAKLLRDLIESIK